MKKLLITGGCGFIGSNFVRYILETYPDYHVVNLDKLTYAGNRANLHDLEDDPRYDFVQGDICDFAVVEPLMSSVDMVANFAAETHVDRSIMGGDAFVRTNVYGAYVLLDCARASGVERFLQGQYRRSVWKYRGGGVDRRLAVGSAQSILSQQSQRRTPYAFLFYHPRFAHPDHPLFEQHRSVSVS